MNKTWLEKTKDLVETSDLPLTEIARGSSLSYRWLSYLMEGRYKDTGINRIQKLHDFLVSQKQGDSTGDPNGTEANSDTNSGDSASTRRTSRNTAPDGMEPEAINQHAA